MIDKDLIEPKFDYTAEDLKAMSPEDKKKFARAILKRILENNPNGITIPQLKEISDFNSRTITKHMEYLTAIREAYKRQFGPRTVLYYPNGRVMHPTLDREYRIGNKYYSFTMIQNPFGEFLYVQEKTKDEYNLYTVTGGIVVQKENIPDLIKHIEDFSKEVNKWTQ